MWPAASTPACSALRVLPENELFLTFGCGGSRLVITRSTTGTADDAAKASWHVDDITAEAAQLRARAPTSSAGRSGQA